MKTNEVYLYHILDAICQIESYTAEIDRIDLDIVWEVIHNDLPTLKSSVRRLLPE